MKNRRKMQNSADEIIRLKDEKRTADLAMLHNKREWLINRGYSKKESELLIKDLCE